MPSHEGDNEGGGKNRGSTPPPPSRDALQLDSTEGHELVSRWQKEQLELASRVVLSDESSGFSLPSDVLRTAVCSVGGDSSTSGGMALGGDEAAASAASSGGQPQQRHAARALSVVGGVDISFVKGTALAVSSIVVMAYPSMRVMHTFMRHCTMDLPYIPGYLAFREAPALLPLLEEVRRSVPPDEFPQLLLVDGNGVHHHRRCGLASHLGVLADIPAVGVAKGLLAVDGLSREGVRDALATAAASGHKVMPLRGDSGEMWGYAALTGKSTTKPIFISPGHRVSFATALAVVLSTAAVRIPEPIRQADLLSRAYVRKHLAHLEVATPPHDEQQEEEEATVPR